MSDSQSTGVRRLNSPLRMIRGLDSIESKLQEQSASHPIAQRIKKEGNIESEGTSDLCCSCLHPRPALNPKTLALSVSLFGLAYSIFQPKFTV